MRLLGASAWPDLDPGDAILAVPLGATEQHGPHLPLATDTAIAEALVRHAAGTMPDLIAAPVLPYGASGEHQDFPGTLSVGIRAVEMILIELARSASETFRRILFVSAHGGNTLAVTAAVRCLRHEGRDVRAWSPTEAWRGDAHAGFIETSLMLALDPASVRLEAAEPGDLRPLGRLLPLLSQHGVAAVSPNGVLGDPAGASAAHGQRLLNAAVRDLEAAIGEWSRAEVDWL
jgi:creatinine amidohydrolase